MYKTRLALLALSAAVSTAYADAGLQTWDFRYTGANEVGKGWNPDWTMAGTFTGRDLNADGSIELGELSSFLLRGRDFAACNPGEYTRCRMTEFLLDRSGALRFHASLTSSDPEGWYGSIEYYSSFGGEYTDYYTPVTNLVHDYRITAGTSISVTQVAGPVMPPAVPEPAPAGMLFLGLALLGAVRVRYANDRWSAR